VITFALPKELSATEPPEERGLTRDGVRLLVAEKRRPAGPAQVPAHEDAAVWHARFRDLGRFLDPGDLVVVNTSATLPAAVDAGTVTVHFSTPLDYHRWIVELRRPDQSGPVRDAVAGERIELPYGAVLTLESAVSDRLWRARLASPGEGPVEEYLERAGRPVTYGYLRGRWPLSAYQTVFAREPGSAEMPSAGRPFTAELVSGLVSAGVAVAPIVLHTGVSSLESGESPQPERFRVPPATATLVNAVRAAGGRVVAVGTTVVRALETVAEPDGWVNAGCGWTDLVLGPDRPARTVTGLVTGLHEPEASHLLLLEAVAGPELVQRAYDAAVSGRYLWHEFGDSCLLLPDGSSA
jgi:S-adenosylmethionine:tRNA ribosyltransferase-isomerase